MEYLDICDENGKLTGKKELKKEVHKQGLWHRSAHIWVINSKKEILIQKRSSIVDNHPNEWDISAAGHISAGEDYITSAQRETEEELGIKIDLNYLILIGVVKQQSERPGYINKEINPVYILKADLDLSQIKLQEEEVSEVKFIDYKELKRIIESKNKTFVPHDDEYKLLFDYLENKWN
ncbi:MAG: NUDIX domain-containing protein [Patescibacteria group bacterium]